MAKGWTKRGIKNMADITFRGASPPANFFMALCTDATAPTVNTVTLSQMTEIAAGAGYSAGGYSVSRNAVDFPSLVEEVGAGGNVTTTLKDVVALATGGDELPLSGSGARYAVLLGPHATPASREVWMVFDLQSAKTVSDGQALTIKDPTVTITASIA